MESLKPKLPIILLLLFLAISCESKRVDPEPNKAFGEINFGITNKEYNEAISGAFNKLTKVGDYYAIGEFKFNNIAPEFYKNKFYKITFSGYRYRTLSEIRKAVQVISSEFNEKYGKNESEYDFLTEQHIEFSNHFPGPSWYGTDKTLSMEYLISDGGYEIFLTIEKTSVVVEMMSNDYIKEKRENNKLKEVF